METAAGPVAMDTAAPPGGRRHSLLAVIGEIGTEPERGALRGALEREDVAVPQIALTAAVGHNDNDTAASQQDLPCRVPPCSRSGIRSWNINTLYCDLNQQLRLFVTRHLAQFSSEVKVGEAVLLMDKVVKESTWTLLKCATD